jgi:hypothetical protein
VPCHGMGYIAEASDEDMRGGENHASKYSEGRVRSGLVMRRGQAYSLLAVFDRVVFVF